MKFIEWLKKLFASKPNENITLSAKEYELMKSQAELFNKNKSIIDAQKQQELANQVGLTLDDPIFKKIQETLEKHDKKFEEDQKEIASLKQKDTDKDERLKKLESINSQSLNKLTTMTDIALKLQEKATYTKEYALQIIDRTISINNKYYKEQINSEDNLIESYNKVISGIEKQITVLDKRLSGLQIESRKMFADQTTFTKQIKDVNDQIYKEKQEIDKCNRLITKSIGNKGIIELEVTRNNNQFLKAKAEIEKIEIISKEEIKRILDDVIKLNEANGITVPQGAFDLINGHNNNVNNSLQVVSS